MRRTWPLSCALLLALACVNSVTSELHAIAPRQDNGASHSPSTTQSATPSTASTSQQPTSNAPSSGTAQSGGSSGSSKPTASNSGASGASSSGSHAGTTTTDGTTASSTDTASSMTSSSTSSLAMPTTSPIPTSAYKGDLSTDPSQLPLEPHITPALSVAGLLMMLLGTVYTLIGIKNRRVHIFLSTAFLTSLTVTVLVIYVMNPPVSNAIQGAYLVAAVVTGLIFGVGSVIFSEVTEGLGCLLGGFCLSMWFLVLKPGGLLPSSSQKAIFISAFCVVIYSLSFSRYTRPYGLIGSTSFAGATIVALGIDCFSRAGMKEFWLYIWALNPNLFPLGTTTYPLTRGIRVEIAGIVLFFLLGLVSQSKLWMVIKERREKKDAEGRERERQRELEEENLGRQLEEGNYRDRAQWEAIYGDKDKINVNVADSGIGTPDAESRKVSASIDAREAGLSRGGSIELADMNGHKGGSHGGTAPKRASRLRDSTTPTVQIVRDEDEIKEIGKDGGAFLTTAIPDGFLEVSTYGQSSTPSLSNADPSKSAQNEAPAPSDVVPLPSKTSVAEDPDDDARSAVTFAEPDRHEGAHQPKRQSSRSILKRLSGFSLLEPSQSQEALVIRYPEDDRASSIAATIDEDADEMRSLGPGEYGSSFEKRHSQILTLPDFSTFDQAGNRLSMAQKSHESELNVAGEAPPATRIPANEPSPSSGFGFPSLDSSGEPSKLSTERTLLTSSTNPKNDKAADRETSGPLDPQQAQAEDSHSRPDLSKTTGPSETLGRPSSKAGLNEQMPAKFSTVAMAYRANEWAKHLDRAERPDLDELDIGEGSTERGKEEPAAPVRVVDLSQTALSGQPPPAPRDRSPRPSQGYRQSGGFDRSASKTSLQSQEKRRSNPPIAIGAIPQRLSSQNLTVPGVSPQPPQLMTRGLRTSSTPLTGQGLVESPLEEGVETRFPPRFTPSPMPTNTLIAKRDTMVRNRFSSLPVSKVPSPAESCVQLTPNDSASVRNLRTSSLDDDEADDIPLSERKSLIRQQRQQQRLSAQGAPAERLSNSHQPQRYSTSPYPEKRDAILASWRESVRQDLAQQHQPNYNVEARRQDLLMEKYHATLNQQQQALAANHRESVFDQAMRRGDMLELHKEAIRKMQAAANKHV